MNRFFRSIGTFALATLLAVSCVGYAKHDSVRAEAKPVTLRFSWWGGDSRHKATLAAIAAYEKKNPNVKIEAEYQGFDGYLQKLMTQLVGNTAPDLFQFDYLWKEDLAARGDNFFDFRKARGVDLQQFPAKVLKDYCSIHGKLIGLPMGTNGFGVLINKPFFQKFGLAPDTEWTWDKVIEEGRRIHNQDKNAYLIAFDLGGATGGIGEYMIGNYIRSKTGKYWLGNKFNIAASKKDLTEAFKVMKDLYSSGAAQPLGEAALFDGKLEQNPKWINGQLGMLTDWSGTAGKYKQAIKPENFTVNQPVFVKGGKDTSVSFKPAMLLGISKKSPNAKEALKFANWFLNDKEAALILTDQRSIPTSAVAQQTIVAAGKVDADVAKLVNYAVKSPAAPPPVTAGNTQIAEILKDVCTKAVFGRLTPEQAADELTKRVQAKLNELKGKQ